MLYQDFDSLTRALGDGYFKSRVPEGVAASLASGRVLREYQKEALGRLEFYLGEYQGRQTPVHLLFNMATGSGKTLVMAGAIVHLYRLGYRNFVFFVNSTNIIKKTRDNFLNPQSSKYLFADKIEVSGREVAVRAVENFSSTDLDGINILFTTIQGLHARMNAPRENVLTEEDFDDRDVVFLSDEAHHVNALTRAGKPSADEEIERQTWEGTITRVLHKNPRNVMLEFTATIDTQNADIAKKYEEKLIYRYDLAQFRSDGFSKEIEIAGRNLDPMDRALSAVVLSQYRRKVAEHHGLQLKPVVLFKSKSIQDSKDFEVAFHEAVRTLKASTLKALRPKASDDQPTLANAFTFFDANHITLSDLAREIKDDFAPEKCRSVNSKDDSEQKQLEVNSLEEKHNHVRAIFAVDKLNEGWDVLNLFDIVRLYETRQSGGRTISPATMAEAQLVGRGARYWPFSLSADDEDRFVRKYDEDTGNELRILEQLHYHSKYDSRYIAEIKNALVKTGAMAKPEDLREYDIQVKEGIKKTAFWKTGQVFLNEKRSTGRKHIKGLKDVPGIPPRFIFDLQRGGGSDVAVFKEAGAQVVREKTSRDITPIDAVLWREALSRLPFYRFDSLSRFFPNLTSVQEFITADAYLGGATIAVRGELQDLGAVTRSEVLQAALEALRQIEQLVVNNTGEYEGTKEFVPRPIHKVVRDKHIKVAVSEGGDQEFGVPMRTARTASLQLDLAKKDWYVYDENYGTREEKELVHFIHDAMADLEERYEDVRLLRNERLFPIYRFSDGARIEPDFVLFLREKGNKQAIVHQLFIEPKGAYLVKQDQWKEDFLREIAAEGKVEALFENEQYKVVGLPFFKHDENEAFEEVFEQFRI